MNDLQERHGRTCESYDSEWLGVRSPVRGTHSQRVSSLASCTSFMADERAHAERERTSAAKPLRHAYGRAASPLRHALYAGRQQNGLLYRSRSREYNEVA